MTINIQTLKAYKEVFQGSLQDTVVFSEDLRADRIEYLENCENSVVLVLKGKEKPWYIYRTMKGDWSLRQGNDTVYADPGIGTEKMNLWDQMITFFYGNKFTAIYPDNYPYMSETRIYYDCFGPATAFEKFEDAIELFDAYELVSITGRHPKGCLLTENKRMAIYKHDGRWCLSDVRAPTLFDSLKSMFYELD